MFLYNVVGGYDKPHQFTAKRGIWLVGDNQSKPLLYKIQIDLGRVKKNKSSWIANSWWWLRLQMFW